MPNLDQKPEVTVRRVLIVDLNNFARYPSVPVGYLAAVCREAGHEVSVFSPLMLGVGGVVRERPAKWYGLAVEKLNYRAATSRSSLLRRAREQVAKLRAPDLGKEQAAVVTKFEQLLVEQKPDVVLVSSYLMYRDHTAEICAACKEAGVPALVGGPYFAQPEVVAEWVDIPGAVAIVGGEVELELPAILESIVAGDDLTRHTGLWLRGPEGTLLGGARTPLKDLDDVPFPDYVDFPWEKYPNRIVPVITGRGCGWGACSFCSDVTSTAGRTYRSRSPRNVLDELAYHHERHGASLYTFTDLKLNSDLDVWNAVLDNMQRVAPGSRWIAAVHVDANGPRGHANGLTADDLKRAAVSGCVRLTTGLESGSQRVLDLMKKGADVEHTGRFLDDAHAVGISMRCTMILGYPGETVADVVATAEFLERHSHSIERVSLNRFQIMTGTRFHRTLEAKPDAHAQLTQLTINHKVAQVDHRYTEADDPVYRSAVMRLLAAVHAINRKPLMERARDFDGVM